MLKYFLVGETHGTNEAPEACWNILKKHKTPNLALEFSCEYQKEVDAFLKNKMGIDELSIFDVEGSHDGRASPAIKRLMLKARKNKIKIFFVDSDRGHIHQRENEMTKNLMKIKGKLVYLCGDGHASKKEIHLSRVFIIIFRVIRLFNSKYPKFERVITTCGSLLPERETESYKVVSLHGGKFYNFKIKNAGKCKIDKKFDSFPVIVPSQTKRYNFLYVVEKFSASKL